MRRLIPALVVAVLAAPALADIESLRAEAGAAAASGEIDTATMKLREILLQSPDDGPAHYQLGSLIMDNGGDPEDAIPYFVTAGEQGFQPLGAAYRLSRLYARSGRETDALEQLETMASGGFALLNLIEDQQDYAGIKSEPRYIASVERIRAARFPCAADEQHQAFDFWIGEWTVTQNGQLAGTNSIQAILGHCVIFEQWESASGSYGKSFNYYDPGHEHWRQIWISDSGTIIEFTGKARDGGIFYTAATTNPADGSVTEHKFEFTQIDNGAVRQFWQTSTDAGATWTTIWDSRYERQHESSE